MKYLQFFAKIFANLQGYSTFDMFQLKDVRQGIYRSNRNKPTLVKC